MGKNEAIVSDEMAAKLVQAPAFAVHTELHGPETVDLSPFMREDILLNLPPHPRCDREVGRVCCTDAKNYTDRNAVQFKLRMMHLIGNRPQSGNLDADAEREIGSELNPLGEIQNPSAEPRSGQERKQNANWD